MKILIAEDDEDIRALLAAILEDEGHVCTVAPDGLAAKELLERDDRYQMLISDVRMPRMDGASLVAWCREKKIHLPVLFLSASTNFPGERGPDASFLAKPVQIDELLGAVQAVATTA